jgi:acetate kinase
MGTRVGDLDPGAVLHMIQQLGMPVEEVSRILNKESGLLGVSGMSGDMRTLLASDDPWAVEAVDLFVYRVAREAASMASALGGMDALVFTGGIGEHAPTIRERVCTQCEWLGVRINPEKNAEGAARIDADGSVPILVIAADEERTLFEAALPFAA